MATYNSTAQEKSKKEATDNQILKFCNLWLWWHSMHQRTL